MDCESGELSRRGMLAALSSAAMGATSLGAAEPATAPAPDALAKREMDLVMHAGMTAQEAECWWLISQAAGKFFELPELHPMDKHEVAHAIHVVQNKLLARPTYRAYLERAKAEAAR